MAGSITHETLLAKLEALEAHDQDAHERLDQRLDRYDTLLHGSNGLDGGLVRDVVQIKTMLRIGVWLGGTIGGLTIAALIGIFFKVAAALGQIPE